MVDAPLRTEFYKHLPGILTGLGIIGTFSGLIIGLQFVLWTLSGAMMALLDMEEVAGGVRRDPPQVIAVTADGWPSVRQKLGSTPVTGLIQTSFGPFNILPL